MVQVSKILKSTAKFIPKALPLFIEDDIFKTIIELKNVYKVLMTSDGEILMDSEGKMLLAEDDEPPITADNRR